MPKTFYTEIDIEDLARRGVNSLVVDDDIVITDSAREKALKLGVQLVREHDKPPSAPERPYIAKQPSPATAKPAPSMDKADLHQRVHSAVMARLGGVADPKLLDTIIRRVLENVGNR